MSDARASRALLRMLHAAAEPVYVLDAQGRIVYANPACAALVGCDVTALLGQTCRYHSSPAGPAADAAAAKLCPPPELPVGQAGAATIALPAADGGWVRRRGWYMSLTSGDGEPRATLCVLAASDQPAEDAPPQDDNAAALHERLARLRHQHTDRFSFDRFVGVSPALRRVRAQVELAATAQASVLVVGPSGSGCEDLARAIHYAAVRLEAPERPGELVPVACGTLPPDLLRSTLEAALAARRDPATGVVTLVLEEADRLPADAQAMLAARLDEAWGGMRLVSTAREPLARCAERGEFRADLAAALATIAIELPPLRERIADLPLLAQHILEDENACGSRQFRGWSPEALDRLSAYPWPGDVAELAHFVRAAHAAARGPEIAADDLPERVRLAADAAARAPRDEPPIDLEAVLAAIETRLIQEALDRAKGNKTRAAELLGLNRPRLYRRLVQLGLAEVDEAGGAND
jgi:DNA-binding NtrC family response regulator